MVKKSLLISDDWMEVYKTVKQREFSSSPVVKTLHFHCRGTGSVPGQGTKIPRDVWWGQKKEKKKVVKQSMTVVSYGETTTPEMGEERKETKKKREERRKTGFTI